MNTGSNFWKSFSFIYHRWLLALLPVLRRGTLLAAASFLICISAHQCVFGWFGFVINKNKERKGKLAESEDPSNYTFLFFPPFFFCDSQIVSRYTPPPPPLACSVCLLLHAYLKKHPLWSQISHFSAFGVSKCERLHSVCFYFWHSLIKLLICSTCNYL